MNSVLTVAVALGSAALGGIAVAWLNVRHERAQVMRDRMLAAADDFTTGIQQALAYVDAVDPGMEPLLLTAESEAQHRLAEFERRIDVAGARLGRVSLLFHPSSAASNKAIHTWACLDSRLRYARKAIAEGRMPTPETTEKFWAARENAIAAHQNFNNAAWDALRRPMRKWVCCTDR